MDVERATDYALGLGQDTGYMATHPGTVLGQLAHSHPVLEGNGRMIMVVHGELAHRAGISIDWNNSSKEQYLAVLTEELLHPNSGTLDDYLRPLIREAATIEMATRDLARLQIRTEENDRLKHIPASLKASVEEFFATRHQPAQSNIGEPESLPNNSGQSKEREI